MNAELKKRQPVKQDWKPFFKLLRISHLPWIPYIVVLVVQLVVNTVTLQLPQVQGEILAGNIQDTTTVVTYAVVTVVNALISLPLSYFNSLNSAITDRNLRRTIWGRIVHMPMRRLDSVPPTSLISRVTSDSSNISYTITYVFSMVTTIYSLATLLAMIAGMNQTMALLMALTIPCIVIASIPSHFMHNVQHEAQGALSKYTNFLAERLGALKQIKASCAEEQEDQKNDADAKAYFKANVKQAVLDLLAQPLTYGMDAVVQAVILIYGGYLLSNGILDTANMVALFNYGTSLPMLCYQFIFFWQELKKSQGATHTVSAFVDCPAEQMQSVRSFAIPDNDLRLEDVSFQYGDGKPVLDHVNLRIPTGKVTAIVGPSGSGKTTVLKLLERLYQPTSGRLMLGDIPAEDIHLSEWRESFGMVPQSSPLLFGTIRDNITYGMPQGSVSEEQLKNAMDAANVTEIVQRLPDGLDTDVGDVGSKLSGGEKQRVALARMMIRDPEYLLLDEATSSLDAENEHKVSKALARMEKGRTTVIVAHNLRTVQQADQILFMENGKVVASGTHQELYATNPTYRRYVDLQEL